MKYFLLFIVVSMMTIAQSMAQTPRWIIGPGQQDTSGNWTSFNAGNLWFYEVDFSGATPTATKRVIGNSINSIQSYGTSDPSATVCDKNGKVIFYVFCAARTAANGNFFSAPTDTMYIVEYNASTNADEVVAKFPTGKFGASVLEMEAVRKGCTDEYYIFYKTIASTYYNDAVNYVVYNHTTKTITASATISANKIHGEGFAVSKQNATHTRYFFYTVFDTTNYKVDIYECAVTAAGVSAPVLAGSSTTYGSSSYPNINPCCIQLSPDGHTLAVTVFNSLGFSNTVLLFDLNMSNGVLSNYRNIYNPNGWIAYAAFSANSQNLFLYQGGGNSLIYYLPVPSSNASLATTPFLNVTSYVHYGGIHMQRAYDGNIYFNPGFGTQTLVRIINCNTAAPSLSPINSHLYGNYQWAGSDLPDDIDGDSLVLPQNFSIGRDTTLCGSITLNSHYQSTVWSTGVVDSQLIVNNAGIYSAYLINGCDTLKDTIHLTQGTVPSFSLGHDTTVCTNANFVLQTGIATTTWSTGHIGSQITVNSPGTYWASVVNNCGSASDTIHISTIAPPPTIHIGNDTVYCGNFIRTIYSNVSNVNWSTGVSANQITINTGGTYWASLSNQCGTSSDTVRITQTAAPNFSLGNDTTICSAGSFKLGVSPNLYPTASYHWQDNQNSSLITATHTGTYSLIITNECGSATSSINITTLNNYCNLCVPNAFSPDGDGINDIFKPIVSCDLPEYVFRVYNRWGQLVFETYDIQSGWNGLYNNITQPLDVFVYYVSFYDNCAAQRKFIKGNVTLLK